MSEEADWDEREKNWHLAPWNMNRVTVARENSREACVWLIKEERFRKEMFLYGINRHADVKNGVYFIKDDVLAVEFKLRFG